MATLRPEDYTMFKKSQPWGYHPIQVEQQMQKYDEALNALTEKYLAARQTCLKMGNKIDQLQQELREMHLQMSSLELPEASEAVEHFVLDDFRQYNSNNNDDSIPSPDIVNDNKDSREHLNNYNNSNNINFNGNNSDDDFLIIT